MIGYFRKTYTLEQVEDAIRSLDISTDPYKLRKRRRIMNLISLLETEEEVKTAAIRQVFKDNIDKYCENYSKEYRLSEEFIFLAHEKQCIEILIKNFLKTRLGIPLTEDVIREVRGLIVRIQSNAEDIVYEKVSWIQRYLHSKSDDLLAKWDDYTEDMRNILSTCRLHLHLEEIKTLPHSHLISIKNKNDRLQVEESKAPSQPTYLPFDKDYRDQWKAQTMKHLLSLKDNRVFSDSSLIGRILMQRCDNELSNSILRLKQKVAFIYVNDDLLYGSGSTIYGTSEVYDSLDVLSYAGLKVFDA